MSLLVLLASSARAQNVGINTTAPALQLDVVGSNNPPYTSLGLRNAVGAGSWDHIYFTHDGSTAFIRAGGADTGLSFQVGNGAAGSYGEQTYTQVLQLLPNGNVGIGLPLPQALLDVNGSVRLRGLGTLAAPTGVVTTDASGNLGSATATAVFGTSFIQNTTTQQASSNFNISGNGVVGGALTVGASNAPGKVLTPVTSTHNMLAVAYGQGTASFDPTTIFVGTSGNFYASSGTGSGSGGYYTLTIQFTAGSGLSTTDLTNYPIIASRADAPGFVRAEGTTGGKITFNVYNASGTLNAGKFNFVVYQP